MSDDTVNYYQPSSGSLVGFDSLNLPTGNPNIARTGWSVEELKRFLLNQSDVNFPSSEFILRVQEMITAHESDFNNPHHTTLDQIVGDFVSEALGSITPGTVPTLPAFYSIDAQLGLPLGTLVPVTYTSNNLFRQAAGGWLVDTADDDLLIATDYTPGVAGIPLFSSLDNIGLENWDTVTGALLNSAAATLSAPGLNYPFGFKVLSENPVNGQFGINLKMVQALDRVYTSSFFLYDVGTGGKVRAFQPSAPGTYAEIDLTTGEGSTSDASMMVKTIKRPDGVIRVWVSFKSSATVADDMLRLVHINEGDATDGTRNGSFGRELFALAHPQTTESNLGHPSLVDLSEPATVSTMGLDLSKVGAPATLSSVIITMTLDIYPELVDSLVSDATILLFDDLSITRDQTTIRVSVAGNPMFTTTILEGLNIFTLSYSPTKLIFKDLQNTRQELTGTYPSLATASVNVGPCGGYLRNLAMYAEADTAQIVEFLTNG